MLASYRSDIVEDKMKLHRSKRNELRQRVTYNKWRLGEFSSLKEEANTGLMELILRTVRRR